MSAGAGWQGDMLDKNMTLGEIEKARRADLKDAQQRIEDVQQRIESAEQELHELDMNMSAVAGETSALDPAEHFRRLENPVHQYQAMETEAKKLRVLVMAREKELRRLHAQESTLIRELYEIDRSIRLQAKVEEEARWQKEAAAIIDKTWAETGMDKKRHRSVDEMARIIQGGPVSWMKADLAQIQAREARGERKREGSSDFGLARRDAARAAKRQKRGDGLWEDPKAAVRRKWLLETQNGRRAGKWLIT